MQAIDVNEEALARQKAARRQLVAQLMQAALPIYEVHPHQNICVLMTKMTVLACQRYGIKAAPLAVSLQGINPAGVEFVQKYDRYPETPQDKIVWDSMGAQFYQILEHVVALLPPPHFTWMIDLTAPQLNEPDNGIQLPCIGQGVGSEFVIGEEPSIYTGPLGELAIYRAKPTNKWYTKKPDWHNPKYYGRFADQLIRSLKTNSEFVEAAKIEN